MGTFKRLFFYWLPPLLWMTVIFYLSSRLRTTVTGEFLYDFLIFKALHMIEYAVLYFFLFRAFYSISKSQLTIDKKLLVPIFLSIVYAISDELHQTFVPTREGKVRDVLIDTAGILLMYIYIKNNINLMKKLL
ncbi:VanZ family protein [Candidatus Roizmanbacteria bacterium]|nr:VanZ family protein [Candidatus Roizmanbacteria bacterium]